MTIENLKTSHPSIPFNPDIANTFFRAGLIEAWGRGTLKIIEACEKAKLLSPIFTGDNSGFGVEFRSNFKEVSGKSSGKILELMTSNPEVTIPEIAEKLNITQRAIEKQIAKLKEQNRIERVGSARGGHWKVLR